MRSHIEPSWEKEVQEEQARKEEVQTLSFHSLRSHHFPPSDLRTGTMPFWSSNLPPSPCSLSLNNEHLSLLFRMQASSTLKLFEPN
jgi:hypothetical protein